MRIRRGSLLHGMVSAVVAAGVLCSVVGTSLGVCFGVAAAYHMIEEAF